MKGVKKKSFLMEKVSTQRKAWVLFMFFLNGAVCAVAGNVLYNMKSVGLYGITKPFKKPWFQTWLMFFAMSLLFVETPIVNTCKCPEYVPGKALRGWGLFRVISIPALLDLVSTVMQNVALLYLPPSVWQMTRGSILLFTALFSIFYRKKKLQCVDWLGVIITIVGICIVGLSTVFGKSNDSDSSSTTNNSSTLMQIVSMILIIAAQGLQSFQTILEEELLHDIDATENEIITYEGLWGLFMTTFIALPIANILPEDAGEGIFEQSVETLVMIKNSLPLIIALCIYCFSILYYNLAGMQVTCFSSAIHRNIYEALRSAAVWILSVIIRYVAPSSGAGESLSWMSLVELLGFSISILGSFIYNRVIKIPGIDYSSSGTSPLDPQPLIDEEAAKKEESK